MNTPINSLLPVSPPSSVNSTVATGDEQSNLSFGEIFDSLTLAPNVVQGATSEDILAKAGFSFKKSNTKSDMSPDAELIGNEQLNAVLLSNLAPTSTDTSLDSAAPSDDAQIATIESSLLTLDPSYANNPLATTTQINNPANGIYGSATATLSTKQGSDSSQAFMMLTAQSRELAQSQTPGENADLEQNVEPTQLFPSLTPSSVASLSSSKVNANPNVRSRLNTTDDQPSTENRLNASELESTFDTNSSLSRLSAGVISSGNEKELPTYFANQSLRASLQQFGLSLAPKSSDSVKLVNESEISTLTESNPSSPTNPKLDAQDLALNIPTNLSTTNTKALPQVPGTPISIYDRGFSEHLNHSIKWMHSSQLDQAEINLNPRDLGPITVHLHLDGNQTKIFLAAEHASTRQALEEAMSQLQDSLAQGGLNLSESHVGTQSQGQSFQDSQRGLLAQTTATTSTQAAETTTTNEQPRPPATNSDHLVDFFA